MAFALRSLLLTIRRYLWCARFLSLRVNASEYAFGDRSTAVLIQEMSDASSVEDCETVRSRAIVIGERAGASGGWRIETPTIIYLTEERVLINLLQCIGRSNAFTQMKRVDLYANKRTRPKGCFNFGYPQNTHDEGSKEEKSSIGWCGFHRLL